MHSRGSTDLDLLPPLPPLWCSVQQQTRWRTRSTRTRHGRERKHGTHEPRRSVQASRCCQAARLHIASLLPCAECGRSVARVRIQPQPVKICNPERLVRACAVGGARRLSTRGARVPPAVQLSHHARTRGSFTWSRCAASTAGGAVQSTGDPRTWDVDALQRWLRRTWPQHASKFANLNGELMTGLAEPYFLDRAPDVGHAIYIAWRKLIALLGTLGPRVQ